MITFATDNTVRLELKLTPPILLTILVALHLSRALYKSTLFMQNKANFQKSQMNVSIFSKKAYENIANWTLGENKPNSKPIKPKTKPIQSQIKPNSLDAQMNVSLAITRNYNNEQ